MKNYLLAIGIILVTYSMTGCESSEKDTEPEEEVIGKKETFEQRVKHEIEAKLLLPATEHYTLRIYKDFINSDTIEDAVITVNRMEYAIDEAIRKNSSAKAAEMGYIGNYNFFFYYDGGLDRFSVPIPAPSSPGRELDISFASITSPTRKDVIIGSRIRNSGWKSYFAVLNEHDLLLVFQWKNFDGLGTDKPEALLHELEDGKDGLSKDIVIYESSIDNYSSNIGDIYKYVPSITKKGKLLYRFFYDPKAAKYRAVNQ